MAQEEEKKSEELKQEVKQEEKPKVEEPKQETLSQETIGVVPSTNMTLTNQNTATSTATTTISAVVSAPASAPAPASGQKIIYPDGSNLYQQVLQLVGCDVLEVFGPTGSGKSGFVMEIANDAIKMGKNVIYIDTEKNIRITPKADHLTYVYKPNWNDMYSYVKSIDTSTKPNLIILDSLGMPALGDYAAKQANERGQILLEVTAVTYKLKWFANAADCLVVITNQPESAFAKEKDVTLQPFGDKHNFFTKELWHTELIESDPTQTVCKVTAHRSRCFGRGANLYILKISGTINQQKRIVERKWSNV